MKKSDVQTHEGGTPALNVKVYDVGASTINVMERFSCSEEDADKALELAFELHQESFWENAPELAKDCFPGQPVRVYSSGRSGGWLIVEGLPDIERWDAIMLGKWARFAKRIAAEIAFQTSAEQILETIDRRDGSTACIADLKAQAQEAGFGAVVRP